MNKGARYFFEYFKEKYLISNLWIPKPKNSYQKENTGNRHFWLTKIFQV